MASCTQGGCLQIPHAVGQVSRRAPRQVRPLRLRLHAAGSCRRCQCPEDYTAREPIILARGWHFPAGGYFAGLPQCYTDDMFLLRRAGGGTHWHARHGGFCWHRRLRSYVPKVSARGHMAEVAPHARHVFGECILDTQRGAGPRCTAHRHCPLQRNGHDWLLRPRRGAGAGVRVRQCHGRMKRGKLAAIAERLYYGGLLTPNAGWASSPCSLARGGKRI